MDRNQERERKIEADKKERELNVYIYMYMNNVYQTEFESGDFVSDPVPTHLPHLHN